MESGQGEAESEDPIAGTENRHIARGVIISAVKDLAGGYRGSVKNWWDSGLFHETCEAAEWAPDWVGSILDAVDALRFDPPSVRDSVATECVRLLKTLAKE